MKDTTCTGLPNHAVAAVGYTADYVLVKNSWGDQWGDQCFIKFARNHENCGLIQYSSYPKLVGTGTTDVSTSDPAASYTDTLNDESSSDDSGDNTNCVDLATNCYSWMCTDSEWTDRTKKYCQKTCSYCSSGACASGTVRCSVGVCRHEHRAYVQPLVSGGGVFKLHLFHLKNLS